MRYVGICLGLSVYCVLVSAHAESDTYGYVANHWDQLEHRYSKIRMEDVPVNNVRSDGRMANDYYEGKALSGPHNAEAPVPPNYQWSQKQRQIRPTAAGQMVYQDLPSPRSPKRSWFSRMFGPKNTNVAPLEKPKMTADRQDIWRQATLDGNQRALSPDVSGPAPKKASPAWVNLFKNTTESDIDEPKRRKPIWD